MGKKLILHRGYKGKYPENSKISFIKALEENLPFEIDIRISKDNVPVIIHDDNLEVLFDEKGKIKELDFAELKKARYKEDSSQMIVSLEEFCEIIGKNYLEIFVHIKEAEDIHETINIFRKYGLIKNINFFACYDETIPLIEIIKKNYSEYKVGLNLVENSQYYNKEYFLMSDFIWADEVSFKWVDKEKIDLAHRLNRKIYCPSPELVTDSVFKDNIKKRWEELILAGIDGIFTDLPDEFIIFYNELNKEKECIFCNKDKIKKEVIFETESFYIKTGFMISAPGHVMVVSKKHYSCLADIPDDILKEYGEVCKKTIKILNKEFGKIFFIDYGPGGQSVHHQHTHFIPLKSEEYEIEDIIKEAVIPTKMQYEKGDLKYLKKVYEKERNYIWFGVDGESYVYHVEGKYDSSKHLSWRYFLSAIRNVKSIPLKWETATDELKIEDNRKIKLTKEKLSKYF